MAADPENTIIMTLESGPVTIALRPDLAPGHVARIKELAREGFYDGVVFHSGDSRLHGQGGDPTGTGGGGSDKPNLKSEFSREPHVRGNLLDGADLHPSFGQQPSSSSASTTPRSPRQLSIRSGARSWRAWSLSTSLPKGEPPAQSGQDRQHEGRRRPLSRAPSPNTGRRVPDEAFRFSISNCPRIASRFGPLRRATRRGCWSLRPGEALLGPFGRRSARFPARRRRPGAERHQGDPRPAERDTRTRRTHGGGRGDVAPPDLAAPLERLHAAGQAAARRRSGSLWRSG